MRFPFISPKMAFAAFRFALGLMLAAHGFMRLYVNSVGGFGEWLNSKGFLIGPAIAWFWTIFDLAGGILMAIGIYARWIAAIFMIEIGMGIILVHAENGWFVVGHQSGGVEYSALILFSLLLIASYDAVKKKQSPA